MRASLESSCIFLPEELATWRKHSRQASQGSTHLEARKEGLFADMAKKHFSYFLKRYPSISAKISRIGLNTVYERDQQSLRNPSKVVGHYEDPRLMRRAMDELNLRNLIFDLRDQPVNEEEFVDREVDASEVYGRKVIIK
jgi:hypothetical protein